MGEHGRDTVGRLFWLGIPGTELDAPTRTVLQRLAAGGVVLFRRNIGTVEQLRGLTAAIHALPSQPLIAIDHEGGRVQRLGAPFTTFPPAAVVGRTGDPRWADAIGRAMALELRCVG